MFASLQNSKKTFKSKKGDLEIMPSVYKPNMTNDVISTLRKCRYLIFTSNETPKLHRINDNSKFRFSLE